MVIETLIPDTLEGLIKGLIGTIVALGGVILLYLIFNIINFYINRKRLKELGKMNKKLDIILNIIDKKEKAKR